MKAESAVKTSFFASNKREDQVKAIFFSLTWKESCPPYYKDPYVLMYKLTLNQFLDIQENIMVQESFREASSRDMQVDMKKNQPKSARR